MPPMSKTCIDRGLVEKVIEQEQILSLSLDKTEFAKEMKSKEIPLEWKNGGIRDIYIYNPLYIVVMHKSSNRLPEDTGHTCMNSIGW